LRTGMVPETLMLLTNMWVALCRFGRKLNSEFVYQLCWTLEH
jgi:hypothetical protein